MPEPGFVWENNSNIQVGQAFLRHEFTVREALLRLMNSWAAELQPQMVAKAPWTDRTGNARQSLSARAYGDARERGGQLGVEIAHGVNYGIFLELIKDGRFNILKRTIESNQSEFMKTVKNLVR